METRLNGNQVLVCFPTLGKNIRLKGDVWFGSKNLRFSFIFLFEPGFHKSNFDYDNDQL